MGNLMREYWFPALPSREFPVNDGDVKRMRLLGENLVMFRDSEGRVGALAEACPHRGASMYFGRNEECGLRCPYHGWKFDVTGKCVDMPTEPEGSNFINKVRAIAYPCRDVNHMVWIYMGKRAEPPQFPTFEVNTLPPESVSQPNVMMEEANWMQNMEGDLDSAHLDWVHKRLHKDGPKPPFGVNGFYNPDPRPPKLDVVATDYGAYYSAMREMPDGTDWHRVNQFIMPFHTMITVGPTVSFRSFVPIDDHHAMLITQTANPEGPIPQAVSDNMVNAFDDVGGYIKRTHDPRSYFMTAANKTNDYMLDRAVQKDLMYNGIPFIMNLPDRAMTELMCDANDQPLYDRTQEHLGTTDVYVIAVRKQLLRAAKALRDKGELPANVSKPELGRVRMGTFVLERGIDWKQAVAPRLNPDNGFPVAADLPLIVD
ncbi:MAG: Rieske 2Fe-2S domain-containing protein [Proteobacteria bacterium]|nr:Rieske 2Fe-2S domain-containing protein [Pseudomonadota bacterium]